MIDDNTFLSCSHDPTLPESKEIQLAKEYQILTKHMCIWGD